MPAKPNNLNYIKHKDFDSQPGKRNWLCKLFAKLHNVLERERERERVSVYVGGEREREREFQMFSILQSKG